MSKNAAKRNRSTALVRYWGEAGRFPVLQTYLRGDRGDAVRVDLVKQNKTNKI